MILIVTLNCNACTIQVCIIVRVHLWLIYDNHKFSIGNLKYMLGHVDISG